MLAEVVQVGIVVEGLVDRVVAERILESRGLSVDPHRVIITRGKTTFDARIAKYNQAARQGPWLAIRDSDHDSDDCPVSLRRSLLEVPQSPGLALRLAVRTIEAWLLADRNAFAQHFAVPASKVPAAPESLDWPKKALVGLCRSSRKRDVRTAMVPPSGATGTGPEYTSFLTRYGREAWHPAAAAQNAPSLRRALAEIDQFVVLGNW